MKNTGAVLVVIGFVIWVGGELTGYPNLIGLGILIVGAVLYFIGRKKLKSTPPPPPLPRP
jgi:hypothetical protein